VSASIAPVKTFTYDPIGNLLSKSDVGTYTYPLAGSMLPHAVSVVAGTINSTFSYDLNGNQTAGLGRSISYTSYNKPSSIAQGSSTLFFSDDIDHQRFKQQAPEGTTLYFNAFGVHAELFASGTSQWYDYVGAGGAMLGMRVLSASTVTTRYFHTDNLGSIAVITDETGAVVERDGYDAWGKRRFPNGADDPTGSLTSQTTRGFTGQEELSDVGLVHLNGRVYDPLIARMMSADPMVPDPMNGQAWNRYSYVVNNPLAFTDPSGYCFLGLCGLGNDISSFFNNIFRQIGRVLRATPILGNIVTIAAAALCAPVGGPVCAVAAAFLTTTAVAGLASGNIGAGLKAGLIAAATAVAFYEVGNLTDMISGAPVGSHTPPALNTEAGTEAYAFNVVAHAAVGCGSAAASGAKCGPSAFAGGVTSAAGPVINGNGFVFGLVANSALGGGAAVLGGGKFENGAITGAFGYLFNACGADPHGCLKAGFAMGLGVGMNSAAAITVGTGGVGALVGGGIGVLDVLVGATVGAISDIIGNAWTGSVYNSDDARRSNPRQGEPGSTSTTTGPDGSPKQDRIYGPDGYPEQDIDYDHDHGQGQPHIHDWSRPADGSPPTADNRLTGRAPIVGNW
jgi:RHS repeat-associated protein